MLYYEEQINEMFGIMQCINYLMYSIPILAVGMSIYLYKTNKYQIIHCSNMALKKESYILSHSIK